jgi:hypothetical protein
MLLLGLVHASRWDALQFLLGVEGLTGLEFGGYEVSAVVSIGQRPWIDSWSVGRSCVCGWRSRLPRPPSADPVCEMDQWSEESVSVRCY